MPLKKIILPSLALLFTLGPICSPTPLFAGVVCKILAIVNDEVITLADLNREGGAIFQQIETKAPAQEKEATLERARDQILERLIENLLIEHRAKELGIEIDDNEVDRAIEMIIEKNSRTKEQFLLDLEKIGVNEETYRENIRKQMLESRVIRIEVRSKVLVTDAMIKEYYDKEYAQDSPEGYNILQMGFTWGPESSSTTREEAQKKAVTIHQQAKNGGLFHELARTHSDMPSAKDGGAIGVFSVDELAPYMRDAIIFLNPGEISQVVETPAGFQFFKLLSKNEGDVISRAPLESVKEDIQEKLLGRETEKLYQSWMDQLRENAFIKKIHSPSS